MPCEIVTPIPYAYTTLEQWRRAMGCVSAWNFWQWLSPVVNQRIDPVILENADQVFGRQNLRDAIMRSEQRFRDFVHYPVVPAHLTDSVDVVSIRNNSFPAVRLAYPVGKLGEAKYTLTATSAVTLTDSYSTGVYDTFTLTATVPAGMTTEQVQLYVRAVDRTDGSSGAVRRWLIDYESATISGTTLSVVGRSWLLGKPSLYQAPPVILDPAISGNYLTQLEVWRYEVDTTKTGKADVRLSGCAEGQDCLSCVDALFCLDDAKVGIVRLQTALTGKPVTFHVNYLCNAHARRSWSYDIAVLAAAELASLLGECAKPYPCVHQWMRDIGEENAQTQRVNTFAQLGNPVGQKAGHLHAWRIINTPGVVQS